MSVFDLLKGLGMESRVELFAAIRRDCRVERLSIRELADRNHVHRPTVRQASALPPARKTPVRVSRRLEEHKPVIDGWLKDDLDAPRKHGIPPGGCWPGWSTR